MVKKLIAIGSTGIILLGTFQANAFFGPFRSLFPYPVGYSGSALGGLQGCLGSFNWFSLPSSYLWPFCW
jgi:hypothetical protein